MNAPQQAAEFKGQTVEVHTEYEDAYVLVVQDSCMSPDLEDGDYAVCSPSAPTAVGGIVAIELVSGRRKLCRLHMDCPKEMWNIKGDVRGLVMVKVNDRPGKMMAVPTDNIVAVHAVVGRELPTPVSD